MKGIEEEVFIPEVDEQGAYKKGDGDMSDEEIEVDEGKFDDESSSDDDRVVNIKEKQKKAKVKKSLEEEWKEMGKLMMTKRQRNLYHSINKGSK